MHFRGHIISRVTSYNVIDRASCFISSACLFIALRCCLNIFLLLQRYLLTELTAGSKHPVVLGPPYHQLGTFKDLNLMDKSSTSVEM